MLMLVPSRGRPHNITRLREVWDTVTTRAELLVAVDDDDPELDAYTSGGPCKVLSQPRKLGPITNALALEYAPNYEFIGIMGDDHVPRTPMWDLWLTSALGGYPGVSYGDDLIQGRKVPTAAVISSELILNLGYIVPPGVEHMYMDCFWKVLGEATHLAWCPGVVMEHMHPTAEKAPWDMGYEYANSIFMYSKDEILYTDFLNNQWPGDRVRLLESLGLAE